jgi:hypothetical protein
LDLDAHHLALANFCQKLRVIEIIRLNGRLVEQIEQDNHDHADGSPEHQILGKTVQKRKPPEVDAPEVPWQTVFVIVTRESLAKQAVIVKMCFRNDKRIFDEKKLF